MEQSRTALAQLVDEADDAVTGLDGGGPEGMLGASGAGKLTRSRSLLKRQLTAEER